MTIFKWTTELDTKLREQWMQKRAIDIAQELGVSKYVVMRRVRKLGLPKKPIDRLLPNNYQWTESMEQHLKSNFLTHSNKELTSHLNVSIQALMRRMKKLGLSRGTDGFTHFKWKEDDIRRLTSLFNDGMQIEEMANEFGISKQTVKRKLKARGLSRLAQKKELM